MLASVPREKLYRYVAIGILATVLVIILMTFRHYGVTWDEELQSQYGLAVVDYYTSFFADRRFAQIYNLYLYGGMFDGLASVFDRYTPFSVYDTRHLLNALFGLLGLWGVWRLGRFLGGGAVGLLALIFLTLTPVYYGHMFNNPKDIPFAAGIVWSIYYMARCFAQWPRVERLSVVKLGIVLGLSLGIRVGGAMVIGFWGVVMGASALIPLIAKNSSLRATVASLWGQGWRLVLPVAIIAYLVMLACWPWAQQSPIMNPFNAFREFENFPHNVEVMLNGTTYMSTKLPWFYVPLYFAVQMPEFILVLLALAVFFIPRTWNACNKPQRQTLALIILMGFAPILYATAAHPALYDAVRHFLFAVPLFCVITALTAHEAYVRALSHFNRSKARTAVAAGIFTVFGIVVAMQICLMIALHPYEYIYANQFVGGVPGAFGRFETEYWGSSFKEAAQDLQAYVASEGGVPPGKIYRIAICGPWDSAMIYLPPDYEPVVASEPAEFFLSTTRWMCQNMRKGREIIRISRLGVPLAVVKDLRPKK
jgi:hypothetical protein